MVYDPATPAWRCPNLIESLKSNLNETEARLQAVFQGLNEYIQYNYEHYFKASTVESGKRKMEEIIPREMKWIKTLPQLFKNISFDFNTGRFNPASLFESWVSESKDQFSPIEELLQNLEDIHRLIMFKQPRFGNQSLVEYLLSRDCSRFDYVDRKCSYYKCDDHYELRHVLEAWSLGWQWMMIVSSAECIHQAKTERSRSECFLDWIFWFESDRPSYLFKQFWLSHLDDQSRKFKFLGKTLFNEKPCSTCQMGEFLKVVATKGNENEVTCQTCPQGTYNLVAGSNTCLKCPSSLPSNDPRRRNFDFFRQCWWTDFQGFEKDVKSGKRR